MLLTLTTLVLAGCAAGGGNPSQSSGQEDRSQTAGSSGETKPDGEASKGDGRLEHPSLGSANAPVVLTEYADYQ